jgi:hypothetical protein
MSCCAKTSDGLCSDVFGLSTLFIDAGNQGVAGNQLATKYFTGNTGANFAAGTKVVFNHGQIGSNIIAVMVSVSDSLGNFYPPNSAISTTTYTLKWNATQVTLDGTGSNLDSQTWQASVEYHQ